jgi:hypothetical protein
MGYLDAWFHDFISVCSFLDVPYERGICTRDIYYLLLNKVSVEILMILFRDVPCFQ